MSQEENNILSKEKKHLNLTERETIERMLRCGASKGKIAKALCRDKSTIKREIKRGGARMRTYISPH